MKLLPAFLLVSRAVDQTKREPAAAASLDVKLNVVGNTEIIATISNVGASNLRLYKTGSILDNSPVQKVDIFAGDSKLPFEGIRMRIATEALPETAFVTIPAGQSLDVDFDVAELHDLSAGGHFDISAKGAISYANEDSTELAGTVSFASNTISADVDGLAARSVLTAYRNKMKRQIVQADCTGTKGETTKNAINGCRNLAQAAANAASNGSAAKMEEYFKSSTATTRNAVAGVFNKVAQECGSTTAGVSKQYCSDVYRACGSTVLAYTAPSLSVMVNCNLFFTELQLLSTRCHAQDQSSTTLHETTHLRQVKGTEDYGVYGYNAVRRLTAAQNLNHADTYTLFANAIQVNC